MALIRTPVAASSAQPAAVAPYVVDSGAASPGPAGGLTPSQLASAYGYDPEGGGSGQTIGIVDAYDDPNVESDLETFDTNYGLPACTAAKACFKKVGQTGSTSSLPPADTTGWSIEISLDVEAAHAACPKCKILLVEAENNGLESLAAGVNEAVALGATVVSNGYGARESGFHGTEEAAYNHPGVPILAAAGDEGYFGWTSVNEGVRGPEMPAAPASLPTVVAVGGTTLKLTTGGARASETVWNDNGPLDDIGLPTKVIGEGIAFGATGGGCSMLFTAMPWQIGVVGWGATGCDSKRLVADVSAVGDPLTGFDIYDSYKCGVTCEPKTIDGGWATFGGTSLSTPLIAGLYGLAGGGHGLAYPGLTLYGHEADASSRFDVISGGNGICGGITPCGEPDRVIESLVDCEGATACDAAPGFDGPSGVGSPNGLGLFKLDPPTAVIGVPPSLSAGVAAQFGASDSSSAYPGSAISTYSWNWGDGTSGAGPSPTHAYAQPGTYAVQLTVTDSNGLTSAVATQTVTVAPRPATPAAVPGRPVVQTPTPAPQPSEVTVPTKDQLSLGGSNLTVQSNGWVLVKLHCEGGSSCRGKITLLAQRTTEVKHKRRSSSVSLGTASFTISGGHTATVKIKLSSPGRGLLSAAHGRLSAKLSLVGVDETLPLSGQITSVHLLEQHATNGKR